MYSVRSTDRLAGKDVIASFLQELKMTSGNLPPGPCPWVSQVLLRARVAAIAPSAMLQRTIPLGLVTQRPGSHARMAVASAHSFVEGCFVSCSHPKRLSLLRQHSLTTVHSYTTFYFTPDGVQGAGSLDIATSHHFRYRQRHKPRPIRGFIRYVFRRPLSASITKRNIRYYSPAS